MQTHPVLVRIRQRRLRRGVTLIEVLIVVAILGLIAGGVAIAVFPQWIKATEEVVTTDALTLRKAAEQWRFTHGADCPTYSILRRDRAVDAASRGVDAWNQPFKIECKDDEIVVASAGPDKRFGSDDDIVVPEPERADR